MLNFQGWFKLKQSHPSQPCYLMSSFTTSLSMLSRSSSHWDTKGHGKRRVTAKFAEIRSWKFIEVSKFSRIENPWKLRWNIIMKVCFRWFSFANRWTSQVPCCSNFPRKFSLDFHGFDGQHVPLTLSTSTIWFWRTQPEQTISEQKHQRSTKRCVTHAFILKQLLHRFLYQNPCERGNGLRYPNSLTGFIPNYHTILQPWSFSDPEVSRTIIGKCRDFCLASQDTCWSCWGINLSGCIMMIWNHWT